ncbi:putative transposase InsK for insertion sequence element IS150 [Thiomicrorhabdus immobilis]|uniref:Transposase InsK for insertion sequence element IS150 n=1 Tax=Thiomicrorhabdus immobilis TaxID=2791037 RepID=A0ABM7MEU9_9GAMM|nr:putative transposase InsK for insertion sequence element IS150 [Thiomicrorhabdus immobilis]
MFYYHQARSALPDRYADVKRAIQQLFNEHKGRYGYRRMTYALRRLGHFLNKKAVQRLMQELNLKSFVRPKRYRSYRGQVGRIAENVLQRNFRVDAPDKKWVTDVTEFKVGEQRVYLSPVIDLFNQEVISYRVAKSARLPLVTDMLKEAINKLTGKVKPIFHSDQGWQYQHSDVQKLLKENGLTQSMSRKGNCLDNAVAENFFGILKTEMYHRKKFNSAEHLMEEIKDYIEYYNTKRIKVKLKGLTPTEYRNQALSAA